MELCISLDGVSRTCVPVSVAGYAYDLKKIFTYKFEFPMLQFVSFASPSVPVHLQV